MGETKVFEADGFVVTTERFVHGSRVYALSDIGSVFPMIDRGLGVAAFIVVVGLAMMAWGGAMLKVIGFLLLPGAYGWTHFITSRTLVLSMGEGIDPISLNVKTDALLGNLVSAINGALSDRRNASAAALHRDLASLPGA